MSNKLEFITLLIFTSIILSITWIYLYLRNKLVSKYEKVLKTKIRIGWRGFLRTNLEPSQVNKEVKKHWRIFKMQLIFLDFAVIFISCFVFLLLTLIIYAVYQAL